MSNDTQTVAGAVVSLWRYPVKSMMGEELNAADVTERGLVGDRVYALLDRSSGKVVSAKNPRKWPSLFRFRAALAGGVDTAESLPVRITLPDGVTVTSQQDQLDQVLSAALGRPVTLASRAPEAPTLEEYWPDMDDLDHRDTVTDEAIPSGTFFDGAAVHLLTTATINRLRQSHPPGRFEVRRFRPNVVIEPATGEDDFVENAWVGRTLALGGEVRLSITRPCPRCVMTTLPQADLPTDPDILCTAVQHNQGHVGVYATVLQGGTIRCGDAVRLVD